MQEAEKMSNGGGAYVDHEPLTYSGIPAMVAISMEFMETMGIRHMIDDACTFDPEERDLSPGMAVKAMIGPTFNIRDKDPLYIVGKAYRAAPVGRLFGKPGLTWKSLNDHALGRALDTLAGVDLEKLFHEIAEACVKAMGLESHVYHMDSTNWKFYGVSRPARDGIPVPEYAGHPKDKRRDLLHYTLQVLTDSNRIIRAIMPADGNSSDSKLDGEMLRFIERNFPENELKLMTVVADSKLVNQKNIQLMERMGIAYVSRCPENFGQRAQRRVKDLVLSRGLLKGGHVKTADVDISVEMGSKHRKVKLRFIAVSRDDRVEACLNHHLAKVEAIRKKYAKLEKCYASSFEGILKSFDSIKASIPDYVEVSPKVIYPEDTEDGMYRIRAEITVDERMMRRLAEDESMFVLVTNLPRSSKDGDNARDGVTADGVRKLYDQEYVVEHSFRFMKSGLGIDTVFLHKPEREYAMMFVLSVATLLCNLMDLRFRASGTELDGRMLTTHGLAYELQSTLILLSDGRIRPFQPDGMDVEVFEYTDILGINPRYLLGHCE